MKALYLAVTALFAVSAAYSGVASIALMEPIGEVFARLELPTSLAVWVGLWKVAGAPVLFASRWPRLREWAYAGFFFELTGAVALHVAAGDTPEQIAPPVMLLAMAAASYGLMRRQERPKPHGFTTEERVGMPA